MELGRGLVRNQTKRIFQIKSNQIMCRCMCMCMCMCMGMCMGMSSFQGQAPTGEEVNKGVLKAT